MSRMYDMRRPRETSFTQSSHPAARLSRGRECAMGRVLMSVVSAIPVLIGRLATIEPAASSAGRAPRRPSKQKGRNRIGPTLQQKRKKCIVASVGISGPTPAWLPGSPRRDTSCHRRWWAAMPERSVGPMSLRGDEARDLPVLRVEIGRSSRTLRSRSCPYTFSFPSDHIMVRPTRSLVVTTSDIGGCPRECNMIKLKSRLAYFEGNSGFASCEATCR